MRLWNYGVVVVKIFNEPELFKKHMTKSSAVNYAKQVAERLRSEGIVGDKVEVWSREVIEEKNIKTWEPQQKRQIKVVE